MSKGALKLKGGMDGTVTFHDSCYLGRYNEIYDAPRNVVKSVSGGKLVEMDRRLSRSFCCGGGGGRMWIDEVIGSRINEVRTDEALALNTSSIALACPYCLTMFEDGLKARDKEGAVKIQDVAEIVVAALE